MGYMPRLSMAPIAGSPLDVNFRTRAALLRNAPGLVVGEPFESLITTARSTIGVGSESANVVAFPAATLRYRSDPLTGDPVGVICEPGTTNYLENSNSISGWNAGGVTIGSPGETDLYGGSTATDVIPTSAGGGINTSVTIPAVSERLTVGFWLRGTGAVAIQCELEDSSGNVVANVNCNFDLATGLLLAETATLGTLIPFTAEGGPYGYKRLGFETVNPGTAVSAVIAIFFPTDAGGLIYADGMISPEGCFSTQITNVGSVTNARASDLIVITDPANIGSLAPEAPLANVIPGFNIHQGTFYLEFVYLGPASDGAVIFSCSDQASGKSMQLVYEPGSIQWTNDVNATPIVLSGAAPGTLIRMAVTYKSGGLWTAAKVGGGGDYVTGLAGVQTSSGNMAAPTNPTALNLGHNIGTGAAYVVFGRIAYLPIALASADLSNQCTA